jgi:transcriptional regulator with XRE-family HTH domain
MDTSQSARTILANKLRELRQKSGMTIYEVGEKIGKSGKTVSAWETGHGQPDAEVFVKLYYLYGAESMSDFYGIVDNGLANDEHDLLSAYRKLNDTGKRFVRMAAQTCVASGLYKPDDDTPTPDDATPPSGT